MSKLKDAVQELQIIEGYVNAYSGCDKINIKLDADGDISACDGRVMFFFKSEDKTPYDIFTFIYGKDLADKLNIQKIEKDEVCTTPRLLK